jgi:hypothetical protein
MGRLGARPILRNSLSNAPFAVPAFARISAKKPIWPCPTGARAFSEPVGGGSRQNSGFVFNL